MWDLRRRALGTWNSMTGYDRLLLALIGVGVLLRLFSVFTRDIISDGAIYVAYAEGMTRYGDIYLEWGQIWPFGVNHPPDYSHWFPPLFPAYLAVWIYIFGMSVTVIRIANFVLSVATLYVIYWCTRDLYDRRKALILTAAMSFQPLLIMAAAHSLSENMVVITYVAAVWAILRGFRDGRYLILGGFLAGLTYLSRSNVGYLFILIGAIGFTWRFYLDRWALFRNKYYIIAGLVFCSIFSMWTIRNIIHFGMGGWETNPIITEMFVSAVNHPPTTALAFKYQIIASIIMFLPIGLFWLPELGVAFKRKREEYFGGLFLATGLPYIVTLIFMASCWVWAVKDIGLPPDMQPPAIWMAGVRYLVITNVPLLWIVFATVRFSRDEQPCWWDRETDRNRPPMAPIRKWYSRYTDTGGMDRVRMFLKDPWWIGILAVSIAIGVISLLYADPIHGSLGIVAAVALVIVKGGRKKMTILLVGFLLATVLVAADPIHEGYIQATYKINEVMEDGDTISVDGGNTSIYVFYPYLERREQPVLYYQEGINTTFIVSYSSRTYDGYVLIGVYQTYHVLGIDLPPYQDDTVVWLWELEENYIARGGTEAREFYHNDVPR